MSKLVEKLTEDVRPRPEPDPVRAANPAVDMMFKSYGGKPETCNNWHAIALCFVEIGIYLITPELKAKADDSESS